MNGMGLRKDNGPRISPFINRNDIQTIATYDFSDDFYVGDEGYFSNSFSDFEDLDKCFYGTLRGTDSNYNTCFIVTSDNSPVPRDIRMFAYFIPWERVSVEYKRKGEKNDEV